MVRFSSAADADSGSASLVSKFDPQGNAVFAVNIPELNVRAIVTDSQANGYVLGVNGTAAMFVAKLDATGKLIYRTSLGIGSPAGIAVDSSGNAYVTGAAVSPNLATC